MRIFIGIFYNNKCERGKILVLLYNFNEVLIEWVWSLCNVESFLFMGREECYKVYI